MWRRSRSSLTQHPLITLVYLHRYVPSLNRHTLVCRHWLAKPLLGLRRRGSNCISVVANAASWRGQGQKRKWHLDRIRSSSGIVGGGSTSLWGVKRSGFPSCGSTTR